MKKEFKVGDFLQYATEQVQEDYFSRRVKEDEEIYKYLFNDYVSWKDTQERLNKRAEEQGYSSSRFSSNGRSWTGDKLDSIDVYEHHYKGQSVIIEYKSFIYKIYALKNGTIETVYFINRKRFSGSSWQEIRSFKDLEDINDKAVEMVEYDVKRIRKHYGKKIKELKQDYRIILKNALTKLEKNKESEIENDKI